MGKLINGHSTKFVQGPLHAGTSIPINGEYNVLIGPNDIGKSSILQYLFKYQVNENGTSGTCLILPDRFYIDATTQPGSRTLDNYNAELFNTMTDNNRHYGGFSGPNPGELPRLLLHHTNFMPQMEILNKYLELFGFHNIDLTGPQHIVMERIMYFYHGSGSRSLLPILCALTDEKIELLLIDEPEISLEAGLQKTLRDLLQKEASKKQIIVSTHSHLFLNRASWSNNYKVSRSGDSILIDPVVSEVELYDITFKMLGNSVEDLFFPRNFIIVEGPSDQEIVNKILLLKGINGTQIKVVSSSGFDNVGNRYSAICNTLIPVVLPGSPYRNTVVAIVDKPNKQNEKKYFEIKKNLSDRLFTLSENSLENYISEQIYSLANKIRKDEVARIEAEHDPIKKGLLKMQLSKALAAALTEDNLSDVQVIVDAVEKANIQA
jgi:hypothetical protein